MRVVVYEDTHTEMFVEFIRRVWNPDFTLAEYLLEQSRPRPKNPFAGDLDETRILAVDGGQILGHVRAVPSRMWVEDREVEMHWANGFHVLPEARGKGVGTAVLAALSERHRLLTTVPVIDASRRAFASNGWRFDFKIPDFVRILNPKRFVENLRQGGFGSTDRRMSRLMSAVLGSAAGGMAARGALAVHPRLLDPFGRCGERSSSVSEVDEFDSRVDDLWSRCRSTLKVAQVRSAAHLNYSFPAARGWQKFVLESAGAVSAAGVCYLKSFEGDSRLHNLRLMSVRDLLWDFEQRRVLGEFIDHVLATAYQSDADALVVSATDERVRRALLPRGFLPIPSTVWYGHHSTDPTIQLPSRMRDWYVTRADSEGHDALGPR
jgi:GNAT superfamily N-acetyltransferase